MTTAPPISILLVEDDRSTAQRIAELLSKEASLQMWGHATSVNKAAALLAEHEVDVILFDLVLQRVDRSREIADLKKRAPDSTLLVLTAYEEPDRIFRALCSGADGYLLKADKSRPLTAAILQALEFGSSFSPSIANKICRYFHALGQEAQKSCSGELTLREEELLGFLTQGLSNKEIATQLGLSIAAVKKHIRSICKKLQAKNRTQAAVRSRLWPAWLSQKK